jgi:hypothetical protein
MRAGNRLGRTVPVERAVDGEVGVSADGTRNERQAPVHLGSQLPTGGKPAETCLAPDSGSTQFVDATTPAIGTGHYYLVRGSNVCGVGTYGTTSGGAPRNTAVCP